jgi:Domain of unknown function (DUF4411)
MSLYLLDANVTITAHNLYYAIDQVEQFWSWLQHQGTSGHVKIPIEIIEEIKQGSKENDLLVDWISNPKNEEALLLDEAVDIALVQHVVSNGYANDLTDIEVGEIGRAPFLIAYALANPTERLVVTTETSKPSAKRQNRKIPDVCIMLGVRCCGPFEMGRVLGFSTNWRSK